MSTPYIGEIRMVGFNFEPQGWALCDGRLLAISENDALFALIGTTYGGDGQTTFALPDLRSRFPIHQGQGPGTSNYILGENGGVEEVTLTVPRMPSHNHVPTANNSAENTDPAGKVWGGWGDYQYSSEAPSVAMATGAVRAEGGSQPHSNMPPYLAVNFVISLFGIFPPQS